MSSKPERAYPTPQNKDAAFNQSSIRLHPTLVLSFVSLICGENTYCSFSGVSNRDLFKQKRKKVSEVKIQEVRRGDTTHHTHSIYIYIYVVYTYIIYCYLEQSCREETLSMLVQHGKPPSLSGFSSQYRMLGGPRLLGLSELGSRQLQKQAIVIFACVLQDCKS